MTQQTGPDPRPRQGGAYDYVGRVRLQYAPERDGEPDPGEVVWAWVPYEDDPRLGKDRPIVVVGHALDAAGELAALQLSSRDHTGDSGWLRIGTGDWDAGGRVSWVRVDRLLAVTPGAVRREGATLAPQAFLAVVEAASGR